MKNAKRQETTNIHGIRKNTWTYEKSCITKGHGNTKSHELRKAMDMRKAMKYEGEGLGNTKIMQVRSYD